MFNINVDLSKEDIRNLMDMTWYLKGRVDVEDNSKNSFCLSHIETLTKIINGKRTVDDPPVINTGSTYEKEGFSI